MSDQCKNLLDRLKLGPITPLAAWGELGIYRLAARVLELRSHGHTIDTVMVRRGNRLVAEYTLRGAA